MSSLVWWQQRTQPPHTQANRVSLYSVAVSCILTATCSRSWLLSMSKWWLFLKRLCIFKRTLQSLQPKEKKCSFCFWETDDYPLPPITECPCLSFFAVLLWEVETLPATKCTSHCCHSGSWTLPIMNIIILWPKIEIFVSELIRQRMGRPK